MSTHAEEWINVHNQQEVEERLKKGQMAPRTCGQAVLSTYDQGTKQSQGSDDYFLEHQSTKSDSVTVAGTATTDAQSGTPGNLDGQAVLLGQGNPDHGTKQSEGSGGGFDEVPDNSEPTAATEESADAGSKTAEQTGTAGDGSEVNGVANTTGQTKAAADPEEKYSDGKSDAGDESEVDSTTNSKATTEKGDTTTDEKKGAEGDGSDSDADAPLKLKKKKGSTKGTGAGRPKGASNKNHFTEGQLEEQLLDSFDIKSTEWQEMAELKHDFFTQRGWSKFSVVFCDPMFKESKCYKAEYVRNLIEIVSPFMLDTGVLLYMGYKIL